MALVPLSLAAQAPAAGGGQPAVGGQMRPPAMTLTTPAFPDGGDIPVKYTQAGEQVSPALTWTNVPPGTQSFVLHMRDPDVARNRGTEDQVHWLVWNIPGTATGLPENVPKGADAQDPHRRRRLHTAFIRYMAELTGQAAAEAVLPAHGLRRLADLDRASSPGTRTARRSTSKRHTRSASSPALARRAAGRRSSSRWTASSARAATR
jgi:hypothetical protein